MILYIGQLLLGGLLLYFGAEWLVRGAAGLARAFSVPALVVGLTVVAYGTSAPELVVSSVASLGGKGEIALGNVIGSNIANLGLILGITAVISPPRIAGSLIRREVPVMLAASLLLPLLLVDGQVSRLEAALFLAAAIGFTAWTLRAAKRGDAAAVAQEAEAEIPSGRHAKLKLGLLTMLGLALIVAGGEVFVRGASGVALELGMSERIVGLTIVAIGTSLPELATSLVAAYRGHSSLAVGNVVGSNIFNLLLILGVAGTVRPISGALATFGLDIAVMLGLTLLGVYSLRGARLMKRAEGTVLVAGYVGFLAVLVVIG